MKVAQIPKALFEETEHQGALGERLYHICMDLVTERLKKASHHPVYMVDGTGNIRAVRIVLVSHIADYPEQQVISCVTGNESPLSVAGFHGLGDSFAHRRRMGSSTLRTIKRLVALHHPSDDMRAFLSACNEVGLSGVHEPYWRDWKFADPSIFLTPDALHQWHKMFIVHPMKWVRKLMGNKELDKRISALQKWVGRRHFTDGFTHHQQQAGREQRDLERTFIAITNGHPKIKGKVTKALRAYLDFIYIAQYEVQSAESLSELRKALRRFHANKAALVKVGIRNTKRIKGHFKIPKLELMQHVARLIKLSGSAPQHSTEFPERCHMTMSKVPYRSTNRKEYGEQMCRFLDRQEKLEWFSFFLDWMQTRRDRDAGLLRKVIADRRLERLRTTLQSRQSLPKNHFRASSSSVMTNGTTAIILTRKPSMKNASPHRVAELYKLDDLHRHLIDYATPFQLASTQGGIEMGGLDVWDHLRLQLRATQTEELLQAAHVSARPPSGDFTYGHCNFVLVRNRPESQIVGIQGQFIIVKALRSSIMLIVKRRPSCCTNPAYLQDKVGGSSAFFGLYSAIQARPPKHHRSPASPCRGRQYQHVSGSPRPKSGQIALKPLG